MSNRANALAERLEQGAQALINLAESLSDAEWQTIVPGENRTVGTLINHVASMYPIEIELTQKLAAGQAITGVTWDDVDHINAQHAQDNAVAAKETTLALLRHNSQAAATVIRNFSDEELNKASGISLNADAPLTTQFFIEDHALRHSFHHFANIRQALKTVLLTTA